MEDRLDPRPYRTHYLCLVREIENYLMTVLALG